MAKSTENLNNAVLSASFALGGGSRVTLTSDNNTYNAVGDVITASSAATTPTIFSVRAGFSPTIVETVRCSGDLKIVVKRGGSLNYRGTIYGEGEYTIHPDGVNLGTIYEEGTHTIHADEVRLSASDSAAATVDHSDLS